MLEPGDNTVSTSRMVSCLPVDVEYPTLEYLGFAVQVSTKYSSSCTKQEAGVARILMPRYPGAGQTFLTAADRWYHIRP